MSNFDIVAVQRNEEVNMGWKIALSLFLTVMLNCGAVAQTGIAVPVFEGDINRPYVVVGEIKDNLRKHFAFQANPTKEKIYAELWERARKMRADAVIYAKFGETKGTLFNHGSTPISGTAIRYTNSITQPK
jgi:hypothetical protein